MYLQKPIIANILLILFISIQGVVLLSRYQILQHKQQELHGEISSNIFLIFTMSQWQQIEKMNESEIRISGKMFDLKSVIFEKDKVVVCGHFDTKEDKLLLKERDLQKKPQSQNNFVNDFNLFYEELNTKLFTAHLFCNPQHAEKYVANYFYCYSGVESPPPQFRC